MEPMTRTHLVLPTKLVDEIDALVGPRRRSEYVAEVLEEQIRRERLKQALGALMAAPPVPAGEAEWDEAESPAQWVHAMRHAEGNRERWLRENRLDQDE